MDGYRILTNGFMIQQGRVAINTASYTDVTLPISYTRFYVVSGLDDSLAVNSSWWSVHPSGRALSLNQFRLACHSGGFYYNWTSIGF